MFVAAAQLHEATKIKFSNPEVVIQKIDISFENFAFPIPTIIRHTTLTTEITHKDRISIKRGWKCFSQTFLRTKTATPSGVTTVNAA
jgi:hypothetical protein